MNPDRLDHLLTEHLRVDAPREAPAGLLDRAMSRVTGTPQRGRWWRRGRTVPLLAAAAVVGLAIVAGTQLAGVINRPPGTSPVPSVTMLPSASAEPSVTVEPSASPSPTPEQSMTPSPSASPTAVPAWVSTGSMLEGRFGHMAVLLGDGTVLVAGGQGLNSVLATVERYDPRTGSWSPLPDMNVARMLDTATLLADGRVLVAGGAQTVGQTSVAALGTSERFDPVAGTWTLMGMMTATRAGHTATLLPDGSVLVAGGSGRESGSDSLASAELYDPATGSWAPTGSMLTRRTGHTATLLRDGKVLVAGGDPTIGGIVLVPRSSTELSSAELYDPATGSWTATGSMHIGRTRHSATLLADGRVLVLGGSTSSGLGAGAELYDPATGSWSLTADMNGEHFGGTATLLADGRVLVAGGGSTGDPPDEIYDPETGTWRDVTLPPRRRTDHTATLLANGTVLLAGGGAPTGLLATAEIYEPNGGG